MSFLNNVGTPLHVGNGGMTVDIAGKATFTGNRGEDGGAVLLSGQAKLLLSGEATFMNNNASNNGGELHTFDCYFSCEQA